MRPGANAYVTAVLGPVRAGARPARPLRNETSLIANGLRSSSCLPNKWQHPARRAENEFEFLFEFELLSGVWRRT